MNASDPLKKVHPLYNLIKTKALEHYQPLCELSVDKRMVKSKARTHFRYYLPKKPIKWGFKYWVVADPTGYTLDFNLYCGRRCISPISENGLTYDVVMDLTESLQFQGYFVFFDNFYTSPTLLHSRKERGIGATGTLTTNRRGVPESVVQLRNALNRSDVPRGTGYYICDTDMMFMCAGGTRNASPSCPTFTLGIPMYQSPEEGGTISLESMRLWTLLFHLL